MTITVKPRSPPPCWPRGAYSMPSRPCTWAIIKARRIRNAFARFARRGTMPTRPGHGILLPEQRRHRRPVSRSQHGLRRLAIVDFDVHHGNGTQHLFEDRADVLVITLHEHPTHLYPGTGYSWSAAARPVRDSRSTFRWIPGPATAIPPGVSGHGAAGHRPPPAGVFAAQ